MFELVIVSVVVIGLILGIKRLARGQSAPTAPPPPREAPPPPPPPWKEYAARAQKALSMEAQKSKEEGRANSVELDDGEKRKWKGTVFYWFKPKDDLPFPFPKGERVILEPEDSPGEKIHVSVSRVMPQEISFRPVRQERQDNFPDKLEKVIVFQDASEIARKWAQRWQEALSYDVPNSRALTLALGVEEPGKRREKEPSEAALSCPEANPGQVAVLRNAGLEISYLWGLPGTGKTATLARVIQDAHLRGERILILANTHIALDNLLKKALERLPDSEDPIIGRFGYPTDEALKVKVLGQPDPEVLPIWAMTSSSFPFQADKVLARANSYARERHSKMRVGHRERERYGRAKPGEGIDLLILEEASMLSAPSSILALACVEGRSLVVGDFLQLGPIITLDSKDESEREHAELLLQSPFEANQLIFEKIPGQRVGELPFVAALTEQYRMEPEIANLVGELTYPSIDIKSPNGKRNKPIMPWKDVIAFVDAGELDAASTQGPAGSRASPVEAILAAAFVEKLQKVTEEVKEKAAFISPFNLHAQIVRELGVSSETVHKYQGSERSLVVWSIVDSPPSDPSDFVHSSNIGDEPSRLLNVGLSRAQHQLIVIADIARLENAKGGKGPTAALARWLQENAKKLSLGDIGVKRNPLYQESEGREALQALKIANRKVLLAGGDELSDPRVQDAIQKSESRGIGIQKTKSTAPYAIADGEVVFAGVLEHKDSRLARVLASKLAEAKPE